MRINVWLLLSHFSVGVCICVCICMNVGSSHPLESESWVNTSCQDGWLCSRGGDMLLQTHLTLFKHRWHRGSYYSARCLVCVECWLCWYGRDTCAWKFSTLCCLFLLCTLAIFEIKYNTSKTIVRQTVFRRQQSTSHWKYEEGIPGVKPATTVTATAKNERSIMIVFEREPSLLWDCDLVPAPVKI